MRLVYKVLIGLWLIPPALFFYGLVLISLTQLGGASLGAFLISLSIYGFIVMSIVSLTLWLLILRKE